MKNIEDIIEEDITSITCQQVKEYRDVMLKSHSASTIRQHFFTLKSFMEYIRISYIDNESYCSLICINPFQIIPVISKAKTYGKYTMQEFIKLLEEVIPEDALFYQIFSKTRFRKDSIRVMNIHRNLIKLEDDFCIHFNENGKELIESIRNEIYECCFKLADIEGNIFHMSPATINNRLRRNSVKIGISEQEIDERKLTLYSLKNME